MGTAAAPVTRSKRARSINTAARYMDAAEALFIRFGYEGTSIRAISARAKMTLGTVVYHWGTKEALFRDICRSRFGYIEQEQFRRLQACEANWQADVAANLDAILRALIEPPMLLPADAKIAQTTRLLYGRVLTDPSPVVLKVTVEIFREAADLFRQLIRQCLPGLDDDVFHWRYTCGIGAFIFAQSFGHRVSYAHSIEGPHTNWQEVCDEIVKFVLAGLLAE